MSSGMLWCVLGLTDADVLMDCSAQNPETSTQEVRNLASFFFFLAGSGWLQSRMNANWMLIKN
jgi:hypothetical protein